MLKSTNQLNSDMCEETSQNEPITATANEEEATIVALRLAGKSNRTIGKILGKSKDAIARRLQRENVKALLDYGGRREVMRIPAACNVLDAALYSDDEAMRVKVAEVTLRNTGISTPHASTFVQNIYNDLRGSTVLSPNTNAILQDWGTRQLPTPHLIEDKSKLYNDSEVLDAEAVD